MPSNKLLTISNLPFVLHNYATAATERFNAIGAKAAFESVQLPDSSPVDRCEYRYCRLSFPLIQDSVNSDGHLH